MKIKLLIGFLLFLCFENIAQDVPIYNQYFMNPYVYNPAFVGHNENPTLFLSHRRQWIGIEGAPVSSSISFHTELKKNAAFGAHLYTEKRGLLTSSTAELALGYKLKLGPKNFVQFGLAAGVGSNNIDLSESPAGATITEDLDNSLFLDGRFGVKVHLGNLNLGFSLPTLFERDYVIDNSAEVSSDPLSKYIAMASYKFVASEDFAFEPHLLYRTLEGDFTQIEAGGVFYIKNIWVGGSYRMDYGATGLLGLNINDKFTIGYAYELATAVVSGFTDGSHELLLSFRLKEKKQDEPERIRRPRFDTRTETF